MSHTVHRGQHLRLPRGFWPACCQHTLNRRYSTALQKALSKSLSYYIESWRSGARTACGMLGDRGARQKRANIGTGNRQMCPELGQLLYDWFIDCLQVYKARRSSLLLMQKARLLRERLLGFGYEPQNVPSLSGEAGYSWFRRWRQRFGVKPRRRVKHLKVSWKKLQQRVRVYLKNVFALRFLWQNASRDSRQTKR